MHSHSPRSESLGSVVRRTAHAVAGLAVGLLVACASGGAGTPETGAGRDVSVRVHNPVGAAQIDLQTDTHTETDYLMRPRTETWALMPALFEKLGVEVGYSDPSTFTMGNAGVEVRRIDGKRLSNWLDCGYGTTAQANADTYNVTLSIMVTLNDLQGAGTEVLTRMEASAKPRAHSGHAVVCTSRRRLEPRIAEIMLELANEPGVE